METSTGAFILPEGFFLLEGLTAQEQALAVRLLEPQERLFRRGETLCSPSCSPHALICLQSGECDVVQGSNSPVTLNTLRPGDCFGVVSLFSQKSSYPTTVVARRESRALFIRRDRIEALMAGFPRVAVNLLVFLTGRIEFLNDRVAALGPVSAEQRLARRLYGLFCEGGSTVPLNCKHTAESLGCSRASLYRALDGLTERGLIARDVRGWLLLDAEGLREAAGIASEQNERMD